MGVDVYDKMVFAYIGISIIIFIVILVIVHYLLLKSGTNKMNSLIITIVVGILIPCYGYILIRKNQDNYKLDFSRHTSFKQ